MNSSNRPLYALTATWLAGLIISGFAPYDRLTWLMEVAPTLIALPLLLATQAKFRFTELAYGLIAVHGLILMLGGAYTYARVPLGFWIQDWLQLGRNPYDKIGHFAQGFVPAIVARELLLQQFSIRSRKLVAFLAISICLAVSALYELIEWGSALALGQGADEFLGTQGDPWDTQSDMFFALIGAVCAIVLLSPAPACSAGHSETSRDSGRPGSLGNSNCSDPGSKWPCVQAPNRRPAASPLFLHALKDGVSRGKDCADQTVCPYYICLNR